MHWNKNHPRLAGESCETARAISPKLRDDGSVQRAIEWSICEPPAHLQQEGTPEPAAAMPLSRVLGSSCDVNDSDRDVYGVHVGEPDADPELHGTGTRSNSAREAAAVANENMDEGSVNQFCAITGADRTTALAALVQGGGVLERAVDLFFEYGPAGLAPPPQQQHTASLLGQQVAGAFSGNLAPGTAANGPDAESIFRAMAEEDSDDDIFEAMAQQESVRDQIVQIFQDASKLLRSGRADSAMPLLVRCEELCPLADDEDVTCAVVQHLGIAHRSLGNLQRAIEYLTRALVIACECDERAKQATVLGSLGSAHFSMGEYKRAIKFYAQALAVARELGDRKGQGTYLGNLGIAYRSVGEYRRAIEFQTQSLVIAREFGNRDGERKTLGNLGNVCF